MAFDTIGVGSGPDDGTGDPIRTAFQKVNANFALAAEMTALLAAANTWYKDSAVSAPAAKWSGTWYTGGTATTTKPHFLIEPPTATSTGWSTAGTGFGINAISTFTGNLIDAQLDGTSKFKVTYQGKLIISQLLLGGTTSSFPALAASGTAVSVQLADGSDNATLSAHSLISSGGGVASNGLVRGTGLQLGSTNVAKWSSTTTYSGTSDLQLQRDAAAILGLRGASSTAAAALSLYTHASSPPSAPGASIAYLYADTSGGKIRIMARFPSGAAQQIAIEP